MKRLVCVVEGKGDVEAIPTLCSRVLHWLGASSWVVDKQAIRQPRTKLVDGAVKGPAKPCKAAEMTRILALATAREPDAVLVLCDADDECPGAWATSVPPTTHHGSPVAAVMAVREYEAWLLWNLTGETLAHIGIKDPERIRDAKGAMARADTTYQPTIHQLPRTRALDIARVASGSRSFRKLVRELARLAGIAAPAAATEKSAKPEPGTGKRTSKPRPSGRS